MVMTMSFNIMENLGQGISRLHEGKVTEKELIKTNVVPVYEHSNRKRLDSDNVLPIDKELGESLKIPNRFFVCSKCDEIFRNRSDYTRHIDKEDCPIIIKNLHTGTRESITRLGKGFPQVSIKRLPSQNLLQSPVLLKSKGKEIAKALSSSPSKSTVPAKRKIYSRGFTFKEDLYRRIKSIHKKRNSFLCNICERKFNQKPVLHNHILGVHTTFKIFRCADCNYGTQKKCYFRTHIEVCRKRKLSNDHDNNSTVVQKNRKPEKLKKMAIKHRCPLCGVLLQDISTFADHINKHSKPLLNRKRFDDPIESPVTTTSEKSRTRRKVKRKACEINVSRPPLRNFHFTAYDHNSEDKERVPQEDYIFEDEGQKNLCIIKETVFHQCVFCDLKFDEKSFLEAHNSEMHLENGRTLINSIGLSTEVKAALAIALANLYKDTNSAVDFEKFQCQLCSITCLNAAALANHKKRHC